MAISMTTSVAFLCISSVNVAVETFPRLWLNVGEETSVMTFFFFIYIQFQILTEFDVRRKFFNRFAVIQLHDINLREALNFSPVPTRHSVSNTSREPIFVIIH